MLKILQLTKKFPFPIKDGEAIAIHALASSYKALGAEVTLLCMNTPKHFFDESQLPILENFLNRFPPEIPLAVELRHESWFENGNRKWADILQQYNRTAVITDVAGRRDVLHMELTNATTMIRFVGNDLHPTDHFRTAEWVERLSRWSEYGLKEAYIFTHEPDNLLAPEMAAIFVKHLLDDLGVKIKGPVFRDENEGEQISLF